VKVARGGEKLARFGKAAGTGLTFAPFAYQGGNIGISIYSFNMASRMQLGGRCYKAEKRLVGNRVKYFCKNGGWVVSDPYAVMTFSALLKSDLKYNYVHE
jgi:hypothetical protein